jgi:hypothetical protein
MDLAIQLMMMVNNGGLVRLSNMQKMLKHFLTPSLLPLLNVRNNQGQQK